MPALCPRTTPLIAVVEDDPHTLEMLDEVLRHAGYQTFLWTRGKDAYLKIRERRPDLVILDMRLEHPQAGEMVLGRMEVDPATRQIPVVICTADLYLRQRSRDFETRGYRLLEKPFAITALLALITTVLGAAPRQPSQDGGGE